MGKPRSRVAQVRVSGPLVPFVAGFRAWLEQAGYTPLSSVVQVRLLAHVSRWLEAGHLGVADLSSDRVEEYLAFRRAASRTESLTGAQWRRCWHSSLLRRFCRLKSCRLPARPSRCCSPRFIATCSPSGG
jgi:hypothetical protein